MSDEDEKLLHDLILMGGGELNIEKFNAEMRKIWPQIMKTNAFLGLPVYDRIDLPPSPPGNGKE